MINKNIKVLKHARQNQTTNLGDKNLPKTLELLKFEGDTKETKMIKIRAQK